MAGEIEAALVRLEKRKEAASGELQQGATAVSEATYRLGLSGFDLDFDEVEDLRSTVAATFRAGSDQGCVPDALAADCFVDGLVVGLLIAEDRQKAEAS